MVFLEGSNEVSMQFHVCFMQFSRMTMTILRLG